MIEYDDLALKMLEAFPELRTEADRLGDESAYWVYETVFVPYIAALLEADEYMERTEGLQRIFAFVEEVATSEGYYEEWWPKQMRTSAKQGPSGIIQVAVMEELLLGYEGDTLIRKAMPFLGPETMKLLEKEARLHGVRLPTV